jgi:hypothetical protein
MGEMVVYCQVMMGGCLYKKQREDSGILIQFAVEHSDACSCTFHYEFINFLPFVGTGGRQC